MAIQINASARLVEAQQMVRAAKADDAGKVVLWIQKALGWKGKRVGKAGQSEGMEFKKKLSGATVWLTVTLDHTQEGSPLHIEGGTMDTANKKLKVQWHVTEKTGRKTILELKDELKRTIGMFRNVDGADELIEAMTKLVRAKSKVEA
jgi:hypothetical protein